MGQDDKISKETSYTDAVKAVSGGSNSFGDKKDSKKIIEDNKKVSVKIGTVNVAR
jgi:hypothetical protein